MAGGAECYGPFRRVADFTARLLGGTSPSGHFEGQLPPLAKLYFFSNVQHNSDRAPMRPALQTQQSLTLSNATSLTQDQPGTYRQTKNNRRLLCIAPRAVSQGSSRPARFGTSQVQIPKPISGRPEDQDARYRWL